VSPFPGKGDINGLRLAPEAVGSAFFPSEIIQFSTMTLMFVMIESALRESAKVYFKG